MTQVNTYLVSCGASSNYVCFFVHTLQAILYKFYAINIINGMVISTPKLLLSPIIQLPKIFEFLNI